MSNYMNGATAEKTSPGLHAAGRRSAITDEAIGSFFQPDSLLSEQYFETFRRKTFFEPEKRLMLAILKDAISIFQADLFAFDVKGRRRFEDAKDWISDLDGDWVFSFVNICEHLGLNPVYIRNGLLRWMENRLAKQNLNGSWERKKMAG